MICCLLSWNFSIEKNIKRYNIAFFILEFFLFIVFSSLNLLVFYLAFEAVLIPIYFVIGFYGSRTRRIRASYMLFFYTLFSSLLMFLALLYIFFIVGSLDYHTIRNFSLLPFTEKICWLAFFFSFAVKMPLLPFHIWLPEAHCEAPTSGSVILAGILLKLGGFGFIRYSLGLFPESSAYFTPLIFLVSVLSVLYASMTTLQQVDLKKIIAYSSVGHMGLVTIGIFSGNSQGIVGSTFLMISHGIISSALFLCISILYERHHTRIIRYFSGLVNTMPIYTCFFFIFTLGNIGLPGTSSFIGEILILFGCFEINNFVCLLAAFGMVIGGGYSLWLFNRIFFGNLKTFSITYSKDLTRLEFFQLIPFVILTIFLGLFPDVITGFITIF